MLILLVSRLCTAACDAPPTRALELVASIESESKVTECMYGDLNKDGLQDAVFVVAAAAQMAKVVVLLQQTNRDFVHLASSATWSTAARDQTMVFLRGPELTISSGGITSAASYHSVTYNFSLQDGSLSLTDQKNTEASYWHRRSDPDYEAGSDFNFVSGEARYWRKQSRKTKRIHRRLPKMPLRSLSGFSFQDDEPPQHPLLNAYIDGGFKLRVPE